MSQEPTIYVIEGDESQRNSIVQLLRSQFTRIREFIGAEAFLAEFNTAERAVLIVDAELSGLSGIDLIAQLNAGGRLPPTIATIRRADVPLTVQAMQKGAIAVVEKPVRQPQLGLLVDQAVKLADVQYKERKRKRDLVGRFAKMKPEERLVLDYVLKGTPNKRIATELDIGLRTVELRRSNIMKKLDATSFSELIQLAMEVGFPNEQTSQ